MQNVILFIDASGKDYETPQKSGNSFMNRFSVNEDASFEIIGIHHLETQQSSNLDNQNRLETQQSLNIGNSAIILENEEQKKGTEIKKCLPKYFVWFLTSFHL